MKTFLLLTLLGLPLQSLAQGTIAASGKIQPAVTVARAQTPAPVTTGTVFRSTITSKIVNREPVDSVMSVGSRDSRVFYFTELRGMKGREIIHRWEFNGKVMAEVRFQVRGNRWRVWSSKNLVAGWGGEWKVSVVDISGKALAVDGFSFNE